MTDSTQKVFIDSNSLIFTALELLHKILDLTYCADPGTPSQRSLNEHSIDLLRKNELPKEMDFNQVNQAFVSSVICKRNHNPREILGYQTPLGVLLSYLDVSILSSLI